MEIDIQSTLKVQKNYIAKYDNIVLHYTIQNILTLRYIILFKIIAYYRDFNALTYL